MQIETLNQNRRKAEPTIALINIVFLMLIFFLVAAQITPSQDKNIELVSTEKLNQSAPPDNLVIQKDGQTTLHGNNVSLENYVIGLSDEQKKKLRIIPDRNVSAIKLIEIANQLRHLGIKEIYLVTENSISKGSAR